MSAVCARHAAAVADLAGVRIHLSPAQTAGGIAVARDTLYPVPDFYHVTFSQEVVGRLADMTARRPSRECFHHIKAYRGECLLFTFHDAFKGHLLISEHIAEPAVAEFCRILGTSYQREPNVKRDPERLKWFLGLLENPHKVR